MRRGKWWSAGKHGPGIRKVPRVSVALTRTSAAHGAPALCAKTDAFMAGPASAALTVVLCLALVAELAELRVVLWWCHGSCLKRPGLVFKLLEAADSEAASDFASLHRHTSMRTAAKRKMCYFAPRVKQVVTPSAHGDLLPGDHSVAPVAERWVEIGRRTTVLMTARGPTLKRPGLVIKLPPSVARITHMAFIGVPQGVPAIDGAYVLMLQFAWYSALHLRATYAVGAAGRTSVSHAASRTRHPATLGESVCSLLSLSLAPSSLVA